MSNDSEVEKQQEMVGYQEKVQNWMENGGKRYYEAILPTSDSPTEQSTTNESSLVKNPRFYAGLVLAFVSGIAMMALISPSSVQEVSSGLTEDVAIMHKNHFPSFHPTQAPSMPTAAPSYTPWTRAPTMISAHKTASVSVFTNDVIVGVAVGGLALIGLVYGLYHWGFFGKKSGESRPLK